jgi:SAM-dependent methyltransferase
LYYFLRSSDLAREGLDHSGSHRFADHIYRAEPSGRGALGRWLDARLLQLPAARAFRHRYVAARDTIAAFVLQRLAAGDQQPLAILSVPCGIPRELVEAAALVRAQLGRLPCHVSFIGLDLDDDVLAEASRFAADAGLTGFRTVRGDALDRAAYPDAADLITCTGLAEFLDEDRAAALYRVLFDVLKPDGLLVTSGMRRRRLSDYLLRLAELRTYYRGDAELRRLLAPLPFRDVRTTVDATGIQTIVTARK